MAKITGTVKWFSEKKGLVLLHLNVVATMFLFIYTAIFGNGYKTLIQGKNV